MSLLGKPVHGITVDDLRGLIDNGIVESRFIEYKADVSLAGDSEKIKFLKHVTSFANSAGGDLIIGLGASDGIPLELIGIEANTVDSVKLRLEQLMHTGVSPRFHATIRTIPLAPERIVILIRVPRSWAQPHRVTLQGHDKFYSRHSAGAYPMDVDQLRMAFLLSSSIPDRLKRLRSEHVDRVCNGRTPVWASVPAVLLQVVPYESLDDLRRIDLTQAKAIGQTGLLTPLGRTGSTTHFNADGLLLTDDQPFNPQRRQIVAYSQVFRSGIIEAANTARFQGPPGRAEKTIPSVALPNDLVKSVGDYTRAQLLLGLSPPFGIAIDLIGVRGFYMPVGDGYTGGEIDRDTISLPLCIQSNADECTSAALRPALDALWNAAGFEQCHHYDDAGNYSPGRR